VSEDTKGVLRFYALVLFFVIGFVGGFFVYHDAMKEHDRRPKMTPAPTRYEKVHNFMMQR